MPALDGLSPAAQAAWRVSFLAELPARAGESLLETAVELRAESGQIIYRQLHRPATPFLSLVTYGLIRVFVSSPRGREVTLRHIKRGDVAGRPAAVVGGYPTGSKPLPAAVCSASRSGPCVRWAAAIPWSHGLCVMS